MQAATIRDCHQVPQNTGPQGSHRNSASGVSGPGHSRPPPRTAVPARSTRQMEQSHGPFPEHSCWPSARGAPPLRAAPSQKGDIGAQQPNHTTRPSDTALPHACWSALVRTQPHRKGHGGCRSDVPCPHLLPPHGSSTPVPQTQCSASAVFVPWVTFPAPSQNLEAQIG